MAGFNLWVLPADTRASGTTFPSTHPFSLSVKWGELWGLEGEQEVSKHCTGGVPGLGSC